MPGRFQKLTRDRTQSRALPSIGDRARNGRRRIGCRVRPLHPARQARCPCAAPSPKAIRQTHRSLGAMRPDVPSRAVGSLPADAATDPARPCGRASARRAAELVQRSQPDSLRRNSATRSARLPTGDSGQPGPSSIPCRRTHRFNVVEQPGSTPREPRQQSSPRHPGVRLIDSLNNHSPASLCEAVQPAETRRIAERLEFHFTPKQRGWPNLAEIQLSVLGLQCLDRRMPDRKTLRGEGGAWQDGRNRTGVGVKRRFKPADARIRLTPLCPPIS